MKLLISVVACELSLLTLMVAAVLLVLFRVSVTPLIASEIVFDDRVIAMP